MPQQAQRIEVDETAVHQARGGARKQGIVIGLIVGLLLAGVSWMGGNASAQGAARTKGISDAHDLAGDLLKAKASLEQVKAALTEGGKSLLGEKPAFPADLGKQLAALNVDFGGDKLAGRRFSGVPAETTHNLFDFITRVQALNDKKDLVVSLLSRLQKPITEELALKGKSPIRFVVLYDDSVDTGGTLLLPLLSPIIPDDKNTVPATLKFLNPEGHNSELPRLTDTKKVPDKGAVIPVVPTSFEKVCPSQAKGQTSQLLVTMNTVIDDIQGQKAADSSEDAKPGLSETAQKLSDALTKVN